MREVCFSYIFKLEMEIYLYILLSNSVRGNLLEFHLALDLEFQILCEFGHTRSAVSEHRSELAPDNETTLHFYHGAHSGRFQCMASHGACG